MTQTNQYILTSDADFADLALEELRRILPHSPDVVSLAPGVLLATSETPFEELAEWWRTGPPIFVRHICPVQAIVPLQGQADVDLVALREVVTTEFAAQIEPNLPFSVQTRILGELPYKPFDVNNALADEIHAVTTAQLNVRTPQQILSVVCAPAPNDPSPNAHQVAFVGLSAVGQNLSDWAGGVRRFAREEGQVSRSEFKLLEALEIFDIDLPARGSALDLGASPGGWTRVLRQHDQYVTAVDPGDLDARLAQDRRIRHKRMTAEDYLADEPEQFDLIVNDMRMDARDSARLMTRFAPQLYAHGMAIMTLKLPEQNRRPVIEQALMLLRQAYAIVGARQLFHNRSEITVYLRPLQKEWSRE